MRRLPVILLLLLIATSLYWLSENRRLVRRAQRLEAQGVMLREQLSGSQEHSAELEAEITRMSSKLSESLGIQRAMTENLAQQREQLAAQRESLRSEQRVRRRVMPAGVRQALTDLNDCLKQDGYGEIRFHWASKIVDGELSGAEFLEHHPDKLESILYSCGRLSIELDRKAGTLTMRLFDGSRSGEAGPEHFPEEGEPLVLTEVNGPMWESRLPFLVNGKGDYPVSAEVRSRPRLDRVTKASWLEKVDHLLSLAETDLHYRLQRFRDLEDGHFIDALLLAYGEGRQLAMSAEADSLQVMVDRRAESVSLILRGGVLRKLGGESDIPSSGYHILLPGVSVEATIEVMLGMVVYR